MKEYRFDSIEKNKSMLHIDYKQILDLDDVLYIRKRTKMVNIDEYVDYHLKTYTNSKKAILLFLKKDIVHQHIIDKYYYLLESKNFDLI